MTPVGILDMFGTGIGRQHAPRQYNEGACHRYLKYSCTLLMQQIFFILNECCYMVHIYRSGGIFLSLSTPWYSASDPTRPFSAGATTVV
jgi:hypothetical protein